MSSPRTRPSTPASSCSDPSSRFLCRCVGAGCGGSGERSVGTRACALRVVQQKPEHGAITMRTTEMTDMLDRWSPYALAILHIVTALIYIEHGTQKLFGF